MPVVLRLLKIVSTACSFIYYFTDNVVWLANMGYASNKVFNTKWKHIKNTSSLLKTMLEVVISIYNVVTKTILARRLEKKLAVFGDNKVDLDSEVHVLARNLILLRREIRFNFVEVLIYLSRMVLLTSSLKLIGHSQLHSIFVSGCGLFQSACQVFKNMKGKKNFHKLTIEDVTLKK